MRRFKTVKVQAYNLKGELYEMVCHDLPARVWQHEIDHLDGVLFIDKMGSLGLHRSQKDLEKFIADFEKAKKKGDLPPGWNRSCESIHDRDTDFKSERNAGGRNRMLFFLLLIVFSDFCLVICKSGIMLCEL